MCIYISVTYYKMTHISEINEPNKYRPPLSSKTRKYTTCIKFGSQHRYIESYKLNKYTDIQGFNWNPQISQYLEWNPKEYWRNPQNRKDFRANIAKYCKYCKFRKDLNCNLRWISLSQPESDNDAGGEEIETS